MNSCRALNHKTLWIEISKVIAGFLFSAAIISCTAAGNISSEASTVGSGSGSSGDLLKSLKQVKIIQEASTTEVETISMLVNTSKALRAALFTMEGVFIQEVEVIWTLTNPLFPSGNLGNAGTKAKTTSFIPTTIGTTLIQATYVGTDFLVTKISDVTDVITVGSSGVASAVSLVSGDAQSGVVNSSLSQTLKVKVVDSFNQALAGIAVAFTVTQGGGSIVTAMPVSTDASGFAEATVSLGTASGTSNNGYRASVVTNSALQVNFTASSLPGPTSQLQWTTNPATAFTGWVFGTQPVVRLRDSFGNQTNATSNVSLTIGTGVGALIGTTTVAAVNGIATFTNVGANTTQTGLILQAAVSAITASSSSFDVAAAPPGACQRTDAFFATLDGGCKDLTTNLVWSARSATTLSHDSAIWDSFTAGSSGIDADDFGRNSDYDATGSNYSVVDSLSTAYCKDLNEGGKTDWRMPSMTELQNYRTSASVGVPPYLNQEASQWIWTSTRDSGTPPYRLKVNPTTGLVDYSPTGSSFYVYCVRGGRSNPSNLYVTTNPTSSFGKNLTGNSVTVVIRDSQNNRVAVKGTNITLASSTVGTLGGTLTVQTDSTGAATFNAWTLDTAGNAIVTVTASGLTSTNFTVKIGNFPHTCVLEDSRFATLEGGCKDKSSLLVWSLKAPTALTWYQAIWGSTTAPFNVQPDGDDGGRLNDYDSSLFGTAPDNSVTNYCHDLVEGGFTDWRMPTYAEILDVHAAGVGAKTHFSNVTSVYIHSSTSVVGTSQIWFLNFFNGYSSTWDKANLGDIFCVRPGTP